MSTWWATRHTARAAGSGAASDGDGAQMSALTTRRTSAVGRFRRQYLRCASPNVSPLLASVADRLRSVISTSARASPEPRSQALVVDPRHARGRVWQRTGSRCKHLLALLAQHALRPHVAVERHGLDAELPAQHPHGGIAFSHRGSGQPHLSSRRGELPANHEMRRRRSGVTPDAKRRDLSHATGRLPHAPSAEPCCGTSAPSGGPFEFRYGRWIMSIPVIPIVAVLGAGTLGYFIGRKTSLCTASVTCSGDADEDKHEETSTASCAPRNQGVEARRGEVSNFSGRGGRGGRSGVQLQCRGPSRALPGWSTTNRPVKSSPLRFTRSATASPIPDREPAGKRRSTTPVESSPLA